MTAPAPLSPRAAVVGGCLLALLAVGCTQAGRSNVRLHLSVAANAGGLTSVRVTATQGGSQVKEAAFDWPSGAAEIEVGLLVPAEVSGEIEVVASAPASGAPVARSESVKVTVTPGKATAEVVPLVLQLIGNVTSDGGGDSGIDAGSDGIDAGADTRSDAAGTGAGGNGAGGSGAGSQDAGTDASIVARAWQTAVRAENNMSEMDVRPAVAIDASGNAIVVWEHGSQIWFNRYNAGSGSWGTEAPVVVAGGQAVSLGLDGQGVATVTWQGVSGNPDQGIWAVSSVVGGGWATPVRLSTANAADAHLAVSANGTAIAVWTENNHVSPGGNEYILWASRRMPGSAWSTKTMLKSATSVSDRVPTAALDPTGNGFVIWEQVPAQPDPGNDSTNSVWISRFTGGAFGTPQTIETYSTGDSDSGHIALNASGNGVASWRQIRNPALELWTRTYDNGVWGTPTLIATSSVSIAYYQVPEVAIDSAGNSVVVWSQGVASGASTARISRHRAGQVSWETPVALETDNLSTSTAGTDDVSPEVGMDGAGNAVVIWRKTGADSLATLWSRRMDASGALGAAVRIDNQNTTSAFAHALAVSANGLAVAAWYYGREFDIWANVFR